MRRVRAQLSGRLFGRSDDRPTDLATPDGGLPPPRLARVPARARPAGAPPRPLRPPARATALLRRASDSSRPSSARLSKSPGETFEPVTATRIGANACRGFSPSRSQSALQRVLDRPRLQRLDRTQRIRSGIERHDRRAAPDRARRRRRRSRRTRGTRRASRSSPGRAAPPARTAPRPSRTPCSRR